MPDTEGDVVAPATRPSFPYRAARSGPCSVWIKVRNPASIAVQRERSENWNR